MISKALMPQSLSTVLAHLIFSTNNRERTIREYVISDLHGSIVWILRNLECPAIQTGEVEDDVHALFCLNRTVTRAQVLEEVKKEGGCKQYV